MARLLGTEHETPVRTHPSRPRKERNIHETPTQAQPVMADLEEEADALLGRLLIFGRNSGVYSNTQLNRKIRNEQKCLPEFVEHGVSGEVMDYLVEAQINDMIDAANLTALQEIIYRLYVSGLDIRHIATVLGKKTRIIYGRLETIKRRVRTAYQEGRYAGWYEVYLSEVRRGK